MNPNSLSRRELIGAGAGLLLANRATAQRATVAPDTTGTAPILLGANENPYGPSSKVRHAIAAAMERCNRYPMRELAELTSAIAAAESVPDDHVLVGLGSMELLKICGAVCALEKQTVMAASPTYEDLPRATRRFGGNLVEVPLDPEQRHDLDAMRNALTQDTGLVYVCNPNNPTGTVVGRPALAAFIKSLPAAVTTLVDEAYMDFVTDGATSSVKDLAISDANVIVLKTFSKLHGLAGQRIGYAIARPARLASLRSARVSLLPQLSIAAAKASLEDQSYLDTCRSRILAERRRLERYCDQAGLPYTVSHGNFLFVQFGARETALRQHLKRQGIMVGRPFAALPGWCRISIGTAAQMDRLYSALNRVPVA
ncbi:MAG: histidinol-phosphate transaminase [Steroidobacteraceae bacterium]